MKIRTLALLLCFSSSAFGQDCAHCFGGFDFWSWIFGAPVSEWPVEYIKVEKVEYERNGKATFCKRPEDMVDTIVLHHSETDPAATPEYINWLHLNRGTKDDPWLMVGYNYIINSPYPGSSLPVPKVTEGRPMDLVGAHAGSYAFTPMDKDQKQMWKEGKIVCGNDRIGFKVDPKMVSKGKIKANVTTLGLVVLGNYHPLSDENPGGFSADPKPTDDTLEMAAKMSCQLQKRWPRIKSIKWHSFYRPTWCPGTLQKYIDQIKTKAKRLGCEFN